MLNHLLMVLRGNFVEISTLNTFFRRNTRVYFNEKANLGIVVHYSNYMICPGHYIKDCLNNRRGAKLFSKEGDFLNKKDEINICQAVITLLKMGDLSSTHLLVQESNSSLKLLFKENILYFSHENVKFIRVKSFLNSVISIIKAFS